METLKYPACTVDWVARLLQLAFPREGNPNFLWEKFLWDNTVVKSKKLSKKVIKIAMKVYCLTETHVSIIFHNLKVIAATLLTAVFGQGEELSI